MKTNIPEIDGILHKLRASTDTSLRAVQRSIVPHFHDLEVTRVPKYIYDEEKFRSYKLLYRIDNISYIKDLNKKMMYDCNILEAIQKKYIKPIMFFINGLFIPYSKIRIITDSRNTYFELDYPIDFNINIEGPFEQGKTHTVFLPPVPNMVSDIYLDIHPAHNTPQYSFNGNLMDNKAENTSIPEDILVKRVVGKMNKNILQFTPNRTADSVTFYTKSLINSFNIDDFNISCIVFPDDSAMISRYESTDPYPKGDFFMFNSNGKAIIGEDKYKNLPKQTLTLIRYKNKLNADIRYGKSNERGLIHIERPPEYRNTIDCLFIFDKGRLIPYFEDKGANLFKTSSNVDYIAYYYKEFPNMDNITKYTNMSTYIQDMIDNKPIATQLKYIASPLDFIYTQGMLKMDRIKQIVLEVCRHNVNLLQEYVDSKSKMETTFYKKEDFISICEDKGDHYLYKKERQIRGRTHGIDMMAFVNGFLHDQEYSFKDYNYVYIKFDKTIVDASDYIEIIVFRDVFNGKIDYVYNKSKPEYTIANYIPIEDMELLSEDIDNHIYKSIPMKDELQYELDYSISNLGEGDILIDLPEYHDGRPFSITSRRKFLHNRYEISDNEMMIKELYKILLPDEFRFCTNKNQFAIFHNGRRVSANDVVVCLNKWNLPFDKRFIHLNKKCKIGDIIDIYYLPDELKEVYNKDTIDERGYVRIKYSDLGYTLDGKNSSIFVNGRRVPSKYIETVGNDCARINIDMTSRKNIAVVRHIYYDDAVFQIMRTVESQWDEMIRNMSDLELDKLFHFHLLLTDTEEDMRANLYPTYMVLYEIFRRYWINGTDKVNIENPLFYVGVYGGKQKILKIDSSIYTISVPKMLNKHVDTTPLEVEIDNSIVIPLNAGVPFINPKDIDHTTYTYYNNNTVTIPNDSNIFESTEENIIDIIEREIIEISEVYKYANSDHLRIDGTVELINTIELVDKYFYESLKHTDILDMSIYELDAGRRFIEYKKLLETDEFKEYFKEYVTLVYVVDASLEYLINYNTGNAGDIYIDGNSLFPYYWDDRINVQIDVEKSLVGIPIDSGLEQIIGLNNKVGD